MIEVYFSGQKLFEFKDNGFIQIVGLNEELKRLIVDIYFKIFTGYKFSDVDMEAMNGYYPEVRKDEKVLRKADIMVIKLSDIEDMIEQLHIKRDSVFLKFLLSLSEELSVSKAVTKVEESLIELSIELDKLLEDKMDMNDLSIVTSINGVDLKKITKSFIDIDFVNQYKQRKSLWLLKDIDIINLFVNYTSLLLEKNNNITVILDGIDTRIGLDSYMYFIERLYVLSEEYPNLKIWLIPKTSRGIWISYEIFDNTYILGDEVVSFGDFDITYESICRNYPDNNLPSRFQVLETLLKLFPFHTADEIYLPTKETVILQVFLNLLDQSPGGLENTELSNLEINFLTGQNR